MIMIRSIAHFSLYIFFFNDTATTEIYTLSLHDALPIWVGKGEQGVLLVEPYKSELLPLWRFRTPEIARESSDALYARLDRKSTRLNSSHANISYAVFCLKKKKQRRHTSYYMHQS